MRYIRVVKRKKQYHVEELKELFKGYWFWKKKIGEAWVQIALYYGKKQAYYHKYKIDNGII